MNKIVAVIIVLMAVAIHFYYCEWDFPDELRNVSQAQYDRTIYFSTSRGHHRRTIHADNVFLLAKPHSNREEAQLWGVILPVGLVGGSLLVIQLWNKHQEHLQ